MFLQIISALSYVISKTLMSINRRQRTTYSPRRVNHIGSINHWLKGISRNRFAIGEALLVHNKAWRISVNTPGQMSCRRSFSADKQNPCRNIYRETRCRRVDTSIEFSRNVLFSSFIFPRSSKWITIDLNRKRAREGSGPGPGERASESAVPASRSVDPAATIYHAAVASIVLLVLRYASRREKSKRERLSLLASEGASSRRVCNMCLSRALLPSLPLRLCFYFSRSLFFCCVIILFFRPNWGRRHWLRTVARGVQSRESNNGLDLFFLAIFLRMFNIFLSFSFYNHRVILFIKSINKNSKYYFYNVSIIMPSMEFVPKKNNSRR